MEFTKELQDFFINIQQNKNPSISIEIGSNEPPLNKYDVMLQLPNEIEYININVVQML